MVVLLKRMFYYLLMFSFFLFIPSVTYSA